jgi:hypothetical protein
VYADSLGVVGRKAKGKPFFFIASLRGGAARRLELTQFCVFDALSNVLSSVH